MARGGGIQIKVAGVWNGAGLKRATEDLRNLGKSATSTANDFGTRMQRMGAAAMVLGKHLTTKVTLPLAAIGAAAGKTSMDFEDSFAKIQGLVGVSADETNRMKDAVLGLAGPTAQAPKQLGDAMFFVASAGLRGQDALEAVEFAAKGSAIGLGETRVVADLVTSAMNAYGPAVLSAEKATDNLTAAVRLGKLEPAALADSMGMVLPIASAMGVGFDEVSAAMAAMSRTGTDASTGATQLRQILAQLLKPTAQAEQALAGVGTSADQVRQSLREKGLLATLQDLHQRFDGNSAAMSAVFGNIRALSGVLDMLGSNVSETEAIFADMTDTTGELEAAFDIASQTSGFKFRQAMANVQVALIELGDTIAPVIGFVSQFVSKLTSAFSSLPGPVKMAVGVIGMFAASLGPALWAWGLLTKSIGTFVKARILQSAILGMQGLSSAVQAAALQTKIGTGVFNAASVAVSGLTKLLGGSLLVIGAAGAAWLEFWRRVNRGRWGEFPDDIERTTLALQRLAVTGRFTGLLNDFDQLSGSADVLNDVRNGLDSINNSDWWKFGADQDWGAWGRGVRGGADEAIEAFANIDNGLAALAQTSREDAAAAFEIMRDKLLDSGFTAEQVAELFPKYHDQVKLAGERSSAAKDGVEGLGGEFDELKSSVADVSDELKNYEDLLRSQVDPIFKVEKANRDLEKANKGVDEAFADLVGQIDEFGFNSPEAAAAADKMRDAQIDLEQSALDAFFAEEQLIDLVGSGQVTMLDARKITDRLAASQKLNGDQAETTRKRWQGFIDTAARTPSNTEANVSSNIAERWREALGLESTLDRLERVRTVQVQVQAIGETAREAVQSIFGRASGGRVEPNQPYMVGERGREMIVPDSGGWVFNHAETRRMLSDSTTGSSQAPVVGGGDTYNITVNGMVGRDKRDVLEFLAKELPRVAVKAGRSQG